MKFAMIAFMVLVSVLLLDVGSCVSALKAHAEYDTRFESHWELADRSSTLAAKQVHLAAFVAALETNRHQFAENSAWFFPVPTEAFDTNLAALKTLLVRLGDLASTDPNSFAYQSAIQQITAQEQGEACGMLAVFSECWFRDTHPLLWGWHGMLLTFLLIFSTLVALGVCAAALDSL